MQQLTLMFENLIPSQFMEQTNGEKSLKLHKHTPQA